MYKFSYENLLSQLENHQINLYTKSENYFNTYKTFFFLQNQYKIAVDYFIIIRIT
jgi:hypothetical protein